MSAMLDVVGRLITFSCFVVTLIEEPVESFKDKFFVFCFNRLTHLCSPSASVKFISPIGTTRQTRLSEYLKWQPGSAVTIASTSTWAIFGAGLTWNRFGRTGARKCKSNGSLSSSVTSSRDPETGFVGLLPPSVTSSGNLRSSRTWQSLARGCHGKYLGHLNRRQATSRMW